MERLAHFHILRRLGAGGMGVVYEARDEKLRRTVALKVLPEALTTNEERRARFLREARSAAAVTHANIATVYEVGEDGQQIYIAMELIEGESLRARLTRGAMRSEEVVSIAKQIAKALAKAHERGIVHRDLKPDNVMLSSDGDVKVLDFGLAKMREAEAQATSASVLENEETASRVTQEGRILGTPGYMSPEQATGKAVDLRSDLFSLGVMLYEMLAGKAPFEGTTTMEILIATSRDEPRPIVEVAPKAPRELREAIARCLAKKPDDRYATARDLLAALDSNAPPSQPSVGDPAPVPSPPASIERRDRESKSKWSRAIAIAVALFFALGGAPYFRRLLRGADGARPAASTSAAPAAAPRTGPTALTDLPPPSSPNKGALDEYATGVRMVRDGAWIEAGPHFERATQLDPSMAMAHIRLGLTHVLGGQPNAVAIGHDHYTAAIANLDKANARDRGFIEALEPILLRSPWDRRECAKRLKSLIERYPDDAELHVMRGWMLAGHAEEELEEGRRATAIDDKYSDGWQVQGNGLQWLGRFDEAMAAYDRCVDVSPRAATCLSWRQNLHAIEGRCAQCEADVRLGMDRDPGSVRFLVRPLYALGRPRDVLHVVLEQRWLSLGESVRPRVRVREEIQLAVAYGDFAGALALADEGLKLTASSQDLADHQALLLPLVEAALESGDGTRAAELANRVVIGRDVWRRGSQITPVRDFATPFFYRVAHDGGKLTKEQLRSYRDAWIATNREAEDAPAEITWVYAWASTIENESDARDAVTALPAGAALHRAGSFAAADPHIGHALFLAGKVDEALPFLERASASCAAWVDVLPYMRALLDLGRAREDRKNLPGACSAYARVLERWGQAKPRSVTADAARARIQALHCAK